MNGNKGYVVTSYVPVIDTTDVKMRRGKSSAARHVKESEACCSQQVEEACLR